MITFIVNFIGILLIALIVWWFWLSKTKFNAVKVEKLIEIKVKDGAYQPATIEAKVNQPFILRFIREDASPCAELVIFDTLHINKALLLREPIDIKLTIKEPGDYDFTCQMGMYRGKLIIR